MERIPKWLQGRLDSEGARRISNAVSKAEEKTTAEIVPMVVGSSIVSGHVPWMLFLIAFSLSWTLIPEHDWLGDGLAIIIAIVATVVLSRFSFVRRWLTPNTDQILSVNRRALLEFHLAHLRSTQGSTGVLLFVSMLERKAIVLADDAVAEKCPPGTWNETIRILTARIKQDQFAIGMTEAIEHLGSLMEAHLPAKSHALNELPNALVIKD